MTGQLWWYVARASGVVGWCLLAASVVWGLALSTRTRPPRVRPNWILDLHRFLGGLATIFVAVHVTGLVADSYTHFGPTDVLLPLASSWRPGAVAWGVVGMYLLVAVELTSLARQRLSRRVWRAIHLASFPLFATATVHALTAGTDTANPVFQVIVWSVVALVAGLTVRRVQQASEGTAHTTTARRHHVTPSPPTPPPERPRPTAPPVLDDRRASGPPVASGGPLR